MALLRKCLIELRTRGLPGAGLASGLPACADTVFPPLDPWRPAMAVPAARRHEPAGRAAPAAPRRPDLND